MPNVNTKPIGLTYSFEPFGESNIIPSSFHEGLPPLLVFSNTSHITSLFDKKRSGTPIAAFCTNMKFDTSADKLITFIMLTTTALL